MYHHYPFKSLFLFLTLCLLSFFVSCQSGPEEPEGQYTVTFSVSNYRQVSFDDLSSSRSSRAVPTDHPATLAHLLVAIYDAETGQQACPTTCHNYEDYETNPDAYRQFSVTLPNGHYRVLVLGYNGSRECNIASLNHITWTDNYVPNTFLYCDEFTLNGGANPNKEITLKHVVSAFRLTTEDAIPAELKKMRFISTAGGTVLNAMTGFAPQSTGRTSEIVVPESVVGSEDLDFTVYLFLPQEQTTTNYTVQALGNNGVLYEKHFYNVPMQINYMTWWKGKFFEESADEEHDAGISLYWDTQWAGTLEINP